MLKFNLRRYEDQARFGLLLSLLSVGTLVVMAVGIFQYINTADWTPYYGPTRKLGVLGSGTVTMLLAAIGFGFGLNSAGQRRNDKAVLSWLGFFCGAIVFCTAVLLLFFFIKRGQPVAR